MCSLPAAGQPHRETYCFCTAPSEPSLINPASRQSHLSITPQKTAPIKHCHDLPRSVRCPKTASWAHFITWHASFPTTTWLPRLPLSFTPWNNCLFLIVHLTFKASITTHFLLPTGNKICLSHKLKDLPLIQSTWLSAQVFLLNFLSPSKRVAWYTIRTLALRDRLSRLNSKIGN